MPYPTNAFKSVTAPRVKDYSVSRQAASQQAALARKKREEEEKRNKGKNKAINKGGNKQDPPPAQPSAKYKWNLPPHTWSLPIKPESMNDSVNPMGDIEKYRRGRMWWYASNVQDFADADEKPIKKTLEERAYGFQFLWNPDTYTTAIQLNTEATPSVQDRFVGVAGAFPSGESISFTIRLDRTNDFACMRALLARNYAVQESTINSIVTQSKNTTVNTNSIAGILAASGIIDPVSVANANNRAFIEMTKYYKTSFAASVDEMELARQIKDLMEVGTVADVEYLYKAINGGNWKNVVGRETSDIGFLTATLLRIDIGPLSYIGYVNSLNVTHIAFSQDMTPIRTDVAVSMNLMASAGLAKTGEPANTAPNGGQ